MSTFVLDAHALVWYFDGDRRLSPTAERSIDLPDSTLVIPTIVLAETKYLFSKKRIRLPFQESLKRFGRGNSPAPSGICKPFGHFFSRDLYDHFGKLLRVRCSFPAK